MSEHKSYHLHDCWLLLKKGDTGALGYLYDAYVDKLFVAALRLTNDREMAKDALQEVFIEIWNYRETLGDIEHPQSYLEKVLRSILYKKFKKENANGNRYLLVDDDLPDEENNVEDRIIALDTDREQHYQLQQALANLTVRQKHILDLRFNHGLTYHQIAHRLGMNYQSVNNLIFRTISRLRTRISLFLIISYLLR